MIKTETGKKIFWLITLSLCWAANASFVKTGDQSFGPIKLMAYRGIISFLFMVVALRIKKLFG